jgi:hypothetical protein
MTSSESADTAEVNARLRELADIFAGAFLRQRVRSGACPETSPNSAAAATARESCRLQTRKRLGRGARPTRRAESRGQNGSVIHSIGSLGLNNPNVSIAERVAVILQVDRAGIGAGLVGSGGGRSLAGKLHVVMD